MHLKLFVLLMSARWATAAHGTTILVRLHWSGDLWKSSVGNDELDSDKQSFWVQNGIGRRFLSPDVFSDGLYTGGESFWSRLSGSSAEWLRKFGFYKK